MSEIAFPNLLSFLEQASIALGILVLFFAWVRRQSAARARRAFVPIEDRTGRPLLPEDLRRPASAGYATDIHSRGPPGRPHDVPRILGRRNN